MAVRLAASCVGAVTYLLAGPAWMREDWYFVNAATGRTSWAGAFEWFTFRPLAIPVHWAAYELATTPAAMLCLQTGVTIISVEVVRRVVATYTDIQTGDRVAVTWALLPVVTSLRWWGGGLYIVVALTMATYAFISPHRRWWTLAAGFTYESTVVPAFVVGLWRRDARLVAAAATPLLWAFAARPDASQLDEWVNPLDVMRGGPGLGLSAAIGAATLLYGGKLAMHNRTALAGLAVFALGVLPFSRFGAALTFVGIDDRAFAVAGIGLAMLLATFPLRSAVTAALTVVTVAAAVNYGQAADVVDRAVRCSTTQGDVVEVPVAASRIDPFPDDWAADYVAVAVSDGQITDGVRYAPNRISDACAWASGVAVVDPKFTAEPDAW